MQSSIGSYGSIAAMAARKPVFGSLPKGAQASRSVLRSDQPENIFGLTAAQLKLKQQVHEYAAQYVAPRAAENDRNYRFNPIVVQELAQRKWLGIAADKAYGGMGKGYLETALAIEEIARVDASLAIALCAHNLAVFMLNKYGTPQQKKEILEPILKGQASLAAFGLTEPDIGSDAASLKSTAIKSGSHYLLTGVKQPITNANIAKTAIIMASTDPTKKGMGVSALIVDRNTPNFRAEEIPFKKEGMRGADWGTLTANQAPVPESNLLGKENEGFLYAKKALDGGRILISALALGVAQGALDQGLQRAKERQQFGKPLVDHQLIQSRLANMAANVRTARLQVYQAARMLDAGILAPEDAAIAKKVAAAVAVDCAEKAVLIHGGLGYTDKFPVERIQRDAACLPIVEGTTDIVDMVIAKELTRKGSEFGRVKPPKKP